MTYLLLLFFCWNLGLAQALLYGFLVFACFLIDILHFCLGSRFLYIFPYGCPVSCLRFPLGFGQAEVPTMLQPKSLLAAMALIGLVVVEIATRLLFWA